MVQSLINLGPANGAINIPPWASIGFRVSGNRYPTSLTVTLTVNAGPVTPVITAGVFQAGFSGTMTPSGGHMDIVVTPAAPFPLNAVIAVNVVTTGSIYGTPPFGTNPNGFTFSGAQSIVGSPYSTFADQSALTLGFVYRYSANSGNASMFNITGNSGSLFSMTKHPNDTFTLAFTGPNGTLTWTVARSVFAPAGTTAMYLVRYSGSAGVTIHRNIQFSSPPQNLTALGLFSGVLPYQLNNGPGEIRLQNQNLIGTLTNGADEICVWPGLFFDAEQLSDYFNGGFVTALTSPNRAFPAPTDWWNAATTAQPSPNNGAAGTPSLVLSGGASFSTNPFGGNNPILGLNSNYSFTIGNGAIMDSDFYLGIRRLRTL